MALPVDLTSGTDVLAKLSNMKSQRQSRKESQARLPGIKAESDVAVQQALEYASDYRKKQRKTKAQAETVQNEQTIELADQNLAAKRAELTTKVLEAEDRQQDIVIDAAATATPETWSKIAPRVKDAFGIELTGDWEKDAKARENLTAAAAKTIEHRQAMEKQNVQLQIAQTYANKLPEDIRTAQAAYPDDPEMQSKMLQELMQAGIAKLKNVGAGTVPQFNPSSPTRAEQSFTQTYFEDVKEAVPEVGGLSASGYKAIRGAAAFRAKAIMEEYGNARQPIDYPTALQMATQELTQTAIKPNPDASPYKPWEPKHIFDRSAATMGAVTETIKNSAYSPEQPKSASNHNYNSPAEVKSDLRSGKISREQAKAILKNNF